MGTSDWTAEAVVLHTSPAAGARVAPGSTVKILEASKAEVVFFSAPMPNLVGRTWDDVTDSPAYTYMVDTRRAPKGKEKPGTIVAQSPKPGAVLTFGQPIKVTVTGTDNERAGQAGVTVPNVDLPNVCKRTKWC